MIYINEQAEVLVFHQKGESLLWEFLMMRRLLNYGFITSNLFSLFQGFTQIGFFDRRVFKQIVPFTFHRDLSSL